MFEPVPEETERVATAIIGAAIEVHRHLGPGFVERIYHEALSAEMRARGMHYDREVAVSVNYKGLLITGQRLDLIVEHAVVVELKAAQRTDPVHDARLISYLHTTGLRLGLLLNFNCLRMKDGIRRIVV